MQKIMSGKSNGETVQEVYYRTRDVFHDAGEFLYALDLLFVIGIVNVDINSGEIQYA